MSRRPTLVFVGGAWHTPKMWEIVASILETQENYKCVCVALPSITMSDQPSATFIEDVEAVRSSIVAETTQGRDVLVVVHSYGGPVGSSAIKGLTTQHRKQDDVPSASAKEDLTSGYVLGIVMLASGFNSTGKSMIDGFGGKPLPEWKLDPESGFATILVDPRELFYHDLPLDEGNYWAGKLENQSLAALTEGRERSYAGWMDVPVWYLSTTEDKALPLDAQRAFVQMAKDAGADVIVREVQSSHSPMLSRPKETVAFILEAVASLAGPKE